MKQNSISQDVNRKIQVRNSTVDFLVFTKDAHEEGIEVRIQDNDVWLTMKSDNCLMWTGVWLGNI